MQVSNHSVVARVASGTDHGEDLRGECDEERQDVEWWRLILYLAKVENGLAWR